MRQKGQSMLYAVVLMPMLLLVVSLVADVGSLQVERVRLRWAEDTALVDAVTEVDRDYYDATGQLRLDSSAAEQVFRRYLAANLEPLRRTMAAGASPESAAADADVAVVNRVPADNPFSGRHLDRPSICGRLRVPFRTGLLPLAGLTSVQTLTVTGDAEIREDSA